MQKTDGIYFLNEQNRQEACDYIDGLSEKTRVIHSDMLFDSFTVTQKETRKNLVIGTVIRLVEDKCVDMLIDVFAELQKTQPNTELWIVGDGEARAELEEQVASLGAEDTVHFYGYQQDPSYYYSNFDIFVQPASYEPWGRNIKEAKYFSLPIIGSATDGISRQITVDETGLLFSPKNSNELQQELLRLIKDADLRNKLGKNARKAALNEGDFIDLIRDHVLPFLKGDG
jgi:glycosyltransferase involved in cell wall biosynthesis